METTFEPQSASSLSNISNESLEIDFCSISIPLEVDKNDDSFMDFFFEKEEENISSFLTSLFDSTKDESNDPEELQLTKPSTKQAPIVLFPLNQSNHQLLQYKFYQRTFHNPLQCQLAFRYLYITSSLLSELY